MCVCREYAREMTSKRHASDVAGREVRLTVGRPAVERLRSGDQDKISVMLNASQKKKPMLALDGLLYHRRTAMIWHKTISFSARVVLHSCPPFSSPAAARSNSPKKARHGQHGPCNRLLPATIAGRLSAAWGIGVADVAAAACSDGVAGAERGGDDVDDGCRS